MEQKLVKETFFKFFTTSLASSVTLSVLSMTDLMIAGNVVGEKGLAAVSLALPVVILVQIASALWGTGGAIVFSARLGEGDLRACGRILTLSLAGALASGLLLGAGGLFFLRPLVSLLGAADGEEFYLASQYVGVLLAGMPVMILSPVMITYLRNDSRQGYSMACVVICSLLNIVLSLFAGIVLKLGILGIGGATVVSLRAGRGKAAAAEPPVWAGKGCLLLKAHGRNFQAGQHGGTDFLLSDAFDCGGQPDAECGGRGCCLCSHQISDQFPFCPL